MQGYAATNLRPGLANITIRPKFYMYSTLSQAACSHSLPGQYISSLLKAVQVPVKDSLGRAGIYRSVKVSGSILCATCSWSAAALKKQLPSAVTVLIRKPAADSWSPKVSCQANGTAGFFADLSFCADLDS